ncbi:MAG: YigZ family protein [Candidatus Krumholzibacteria bacterium]|nr:YigZ family protein [Candidatus Krumholzibacteria bacterium]
MSDTRYIPDGECERELNVRNSKFIGLAVPAEDPEQARNIIRETREKYSGCTHVVYAFITGGEKSEISGMSDDGEPKGTAGRPVMEVLKGRGVVNVLVMIVRYFGGTKLGTGGLVKAYGDCAKAVLSALKVRELVVSVDFRLNVPYRLQRAVTNAIGEAGGEVADIKFADEVEIAGSVPEAGIVELRKKIEDISRGGLSI